MREHASEARLLRQVAICVQKATSGPLLLLVPSPRRVFTCLADSAATRSVISLGIVSAAFKRRLPALVEVSSRTRGRRALICSAVPRRFFESQFLSERRSKQRRSRPRLRKGWDTHTRQRTGERTTHRSVEERHAVRHLLTVARLIRVRLLGARHCPVSSGDVLFPAQPFFHLGGHPRPLSSRCRCLWGTHPCTEA